MTLLNYNLCARSKVKRGDFILDAKRTKDFLELFKFLQFTDVLAFAKLLKVEEKEDFEEFAADIMIAFNELPRGQRRKMLKLCREVSLANKTIKKDLEKEAVENS